MDMKPGGQNFEPLISIIMPLYNAERFLEETLVSISNQIFRDYELICINDGSEDGTENIVYRFQQNDSRIRVLCNEKRAGAAFSRNRGIREARGKYIIFLDGDDIFDEMLLFLAYQKAEQTHADIVMFECIHVSSQHIYEKQEIKHSEGYVSRFCVEPKTVEDISPCDFLLWYSELGSKLFRKDFIIHNQIQFQDLPNDNDTYFVDMAYYLANRIIKLDTPRVMVYARVHFTPSRISANRTPMCIYYAMSKVRDELEKRGIFEKYYKMFNYKAFYLLIGGMMNAKTSQIRNDYRDFLINEGFNRVLNGYGEKYGINQFIECKRNQFVGLESAEKWKDIYSFFEVFLYENLDRISELFQEYKKQNLKIGVWGAGNNGRIFMEFCNNNNLYIDGIIDKDEARAGERCGNCLIQLPHEAGSFDVIISTPQRMYEAVKKEAKAYKADIVIIDIYSFTCMI